MSEFIFAIVRISPILCSHPDCDFTARNAIRLIGTTGDPFTVCGRHKRWAKDQAIQRNGDTYAVPPKPKPRPRRAAGLEQMER